MAPSDGQELVKAINTANNINNSPSAFRFPRGEANVEIDFADDEILVIGKSREVQLGSRVAVVALGTILENAKKAAEILESEIGLKITLIDARFAKPFDQNKLRELVKSHELLITIEEGAMGGFGSAVAQFLHEEALLDDGKCKFRSMVMKDEFIEHNSQAAMQIEAGLGADSIVGLVRKLVG
jgi:1-deoxy-D-xylulose-5-phosphate synthase